MHKWFTMYVFGLLQVIFNWFCVSVGEGCEDVSAWVG